MKRTITCVLLSIICLSFSAGCAGTKDAQPDNTAESAGTAEMTVYDPYMDDLPEGLDYEGYTFKVISYNNAGWYTYIQIEEQNGELINDTAFKRNVEVEDRLNIKLTDQRDGDYMKKFQNSVIAGEEAFDLLISLTSVNYESAIVNNILYDWQKLPYVHLSAAWWNQVANNVYNIRGHQYMAVSDLTISSQQFPFMVFNKDMMDTHGLEYPYAKALNGTWYFDDLTAYLKNTYSDVNGNGRRDDDDLYGLCVIPVTVSYFYYNFGEVMITHDEDGRLVPVINSERFVAIIEKLVDLYTGDSVISKDPHKPFYDGKAMFCAYASSPDNLRTYADTLNFGVLPFPKYDESQKDYVLFSCGGLMAVPSNAGLPERTGAVVEALSAASNKYMAEVYIEVYIENKVLRDIESQDLYRMMLRCTAPNLVWDLDPSKMLMNYPVYFINKKTKDVASYAAVNEEKITTAFNIFNDLLTK